MYLNLYTAAVMPTAFLFQKNCGRYYRRRLAFDKEKSKTEQIAAKKYSANIYADLSKQIQFLESSNVLGVLEDPIKKMNTFLLPHITIIGQEG